MANIEISSEVLDRIEAEALRRRVSASELVTELAEALPPVRPDNERSTPASVAAGESEAGITDRIDELLTASAGTDESTRNRHAYTLRVRSRSGRSASQPDASSSNLTLDRIGSNPR